MLLPSVLSTNRNPRHMTCCVRGFGRMALTAMVLLVAQMLIAMHMASSTNAHEFWLSPVTYEIEPGKPLQVHLRIGQQFKGASYPYIPRHFQRFDVVLGQQVVPVSGRAGDNPAMSMGLDEGLAVLVHVTTETILNYAKWEKFLRFIDEKDLRGVVDRHRERGLPSSNFRERYWRFAKSIVAVGNGQGQDREIGLETEAVLLANPYVDDLDGGLRVRFLYQGKPRANIQVDVFSRNPDDQVKHETVRTNDNGVARVAVAPGHEYLLDAVVMREAPLENGKRAPVWESLWASTTFKIPQ